MQIKKVCIVGGSGFLGQRLANRLSAEGLIIRIPTRDRERRKDNLILIPGVELIHADVHDPQQLAILFDSCDAVINLAGILNERRGTFDTFRAVHIELPQKIIAACNRMGIRRLLHMSALNAAVDARSAYLRSKAEAEQLVHAAPDIHVTSFQPSVIFGPGDSFFNRFAQLLKLSPVLPLACPHSKFTPVYVGDVAEAMARALTRPDCYGRRLALGGPGQYTLEQLVRYTAECLQLHRLILPLPASLSRIQAEVFDVWSFLFNRLGIEQPFSVDNYLSLQTDSITTTAGLASLGINPSSIEAVVPQYLVDTGSRSHYNDYRQQARRRNY